MAYRVELEEPATGQFTWKIVDDAGMHHASSRVYATKEAAAKVACAMARALGVPLVGWNPAMGDCCANATDPVP